MAINIIEQPSATTLWQVTEQIIEALKNDDVLNPEFLEGLIFIDWWWEQPFFEGDEYAYAPIAYFVSANVVDIKNESSGRDRLTVEFTVYLEWRSNADSHAGALTKNQFLGFSPYYNAMHRCLQDFKTSSMESALKRVAGPVIMPGIERKGVLLSTTYRCIVYDCTATPEQLQAQIKEIKIERGDIIMPSEED